MERVGEVGRKTQACRPFVGQPPLDTAIAALAAAQHTVFHLDQLRELGLAAATVRHRASAGRLHRIHHAVYSLVPHELLTREGHWMAAVLACGEGAVLSHRCAAELHGLLQTNQLKVDVTVPHRTDRHRAGLQVHRSTTLTPADVTIVNGIPCTTVARTSLDIADVVRERRLERALDQSEVLEVYDYASLSDQLERNSTRPAAARLGRVLREHRAGDTVTWSELEETFLELCRAAGVPAPEVNEWLVLADGEPPIRADFSWRAPLLVVETDGRRTHRTRSAFESDRRKDQRLTAANVPHFRTTFRQIKYHASEVQRLLIAMLDRGGG
jgi:predicted transcriptional regulator of viral defense system